jgi:hypothetical protein
MNLQLNESMYHTSIHQRLTIKESQVKKEFLKKWQ